MRLRLLLLQAPSLGPLSLCFLHLSLLAQQLSLLLGGLGCNHETLGVQLCSGANDSASSGPLCGAGWLLVTARSCRGAAAALLPLLRSVPAGRLLLPRRRASLLGGIQRCTAQGQR